MPTRHNLHEIARVPAGTDPRMVRFLIEAQQDTEALERTQRIINRVLPLPRARSPLADPAGFMAGARVLSARHALFRSVKSRVLAKILVRELDDIDWLSVASAAESYVPAGAMA